MSATQVIAEPGVGAGPPVILVHGVGLDHAMWDLVSAALVARRTGPSMVVRYDLYGHGRSAPADGALAMDTLIDQLIEVAASASASAGAGVGIGPATPPDVVGLSLGGAIVRGAAARRPDRFGRVVVANTVFNRSEDQRQGNLQRLELAVEQGMAPIADLAVARWFTDDFGRDHPERVEAVRHRLATTGLDGYLPAYRVFVDGDPEMPELLSALTNETLFVTGDRDTGSTPAMTSAMAAQAPNGIATIMADTGHLPPVERPDEFLAILTDFLERPRQ